MSKKKLVWLIWEMQMINIEDIKFQLQNLRVIASSEKNANIYKKMFERGRDNRSKCSVKDTSFVIEEREVDHALGFQDLSRGVVIRKRYRVYENQLKLIIETNDKEEASIVMKKEHKEYPMRFHELEELQDNGMYIGIRQYKPFDDETKW